MAECATEVDRLTLSVIERLKLTMVDEVDSIGGWRDADLKSLVNKYWSERPTGSSHQSTMPGALFSDTTHLVRRIVNDYPSLDPAPLQDVYYAIAWWHEDQTAHRLPPQQALVATLDRAMMVVLVVEGDILARCSSRRSEDDKELPGEDRRQPPPPPATDLITQERAATILGCSVRTIGRRIDDGTLTGYGAKGKRKVSEAQFREKTNVVLQRQARRAASSSR